VPTYQSLTITTSSSFQDFVNQVDVRCPVHGSGPPTSVVAAAFVPIFYIDDDTENLWYASQTGDASSAVWNEINLTVFDASTTQVGITRYATDADFADESNECAVTPFILLGRYAATGDNDDITQISGLTTPLSALQGGTGLAGAGNVAGNILVATGSSGALASLGFFGAGADGGNISTNTNLTYTSPTRYTVTLGPTIQLPAASSAYNGLLFRFKLLDTHPVTWNVNGGGNVEGASTFSVTNDSFGLRCVDLQIINSSWWAC